MLAALTVDSESIDWDIPALYMMESHGAPDMVVISTGKHHNEMFEAIRIIGSADGKPHTQDFRKDTFKRCPNNMIITIAND